MSTRVIQTTLLREVVKADPEFWEKRRKHLEYDWGADRKFYGNPDKRGAYAPEPEEE